MFCGLQLYREIKAESYVNGSIDISNKFSQDSFNYSNTSVVFYHEINDDTNTYSFEKDLIKVEDFNGEDKKYKVTLNDFVLLDAKINAGSIYSLVNIDFYDTNNEIVCKSQLNISIKFLSNKTTLNLSTIGKENASFLEQYFKDNGIRLRVIEIL